LISENLARVNSQIAEAAGKSGRDPQSIRLVAVSKLIPEDKIAQALKAGATLLGESRVQEAEKKIAHLGRQNIRWHFIGHLQQNKVKYIFDLFDLIHSVDRLELAEAIHAAARKRRLTLPVLVQVNVSGEAAKFGIAPQQLENLLASLSRLDGLRVQGLMTIPPYDPDPENSRKYYARLRELRDRMVESNIENISLAELSMGMSNDFTIAIEEGATLVRVGTAIFGKRPDTAH